MLLPLTLGVLHAVEPDHVAVVTGVCLERRGAWKIGLAFGVSHMLAVALLAGLTLLMGEAFLGDRIFHWLDRGAWSFVVLLGCWNLAAAAGWRRTALHAHVHLHGGVRHTHVHDHTALAGHSFHHAAAWLGAFFGLGGIRGFASLLRNAETQGAGSFWLALLLFGLGITATFVLLSLVSGWAASRLGGAGRMRRWLFGISGIGNVGVGLWLLFRF
jgi:hypothetical protein